MQPAAQAALVAGGAITAYLAPKPRDPVVESTVGENELQRKRSDPDTNAYAAFGIEDENDLNILKLVNEQSLSHVLANSTSIAKNKALQIGRFGFPSYHNLRFYDSFCASIDYRTKCPSWTGELINNEDLTENPEVDRKNCPSFSECKDVPLKFRSLLQDYKRSGYSRGHLAPAGDYNACQKDKDLTFQLSGNVVPQEMSMNGCDWLRVERFVKQLIKSTDNDIEQCWIFTGPVYKPTFWNQDGKRMYSVPKYVRRKSTENTDTGNASDAAMNGGEPELELEEVVTVYNAPNTATDGRLKGLVKYTTIGQSMVNVPTHLYKVVLAQRKETPELADSDKYQLAAFMVENEAIPEYRSLTDYLIDIDDLERFVGLQFFPRLRYNAAAENIIRYGELCKNYKCEYDDDERSTSNRLLGAIKTARSLTELQNIWGPVEQTEFDADWVKGMYRREYRYKERKLIKSIQKRLNFMRRFQ